MSEKDLKIQIEEALAEIRGPLQADGGDISMVDFKDGTVSVHLEGACQGCPMASITLQGLVETTLKEKVPEVKKVIAV